MPPDKALDGSGHYLGPATLILASLADGAKHGYALTKDIESFAGVRTAVRRGRLSPAVLRFETRLGRAACAAMAVFLAGACAWVAVPLGARGAGRAPGPFHPGAIDAAGLVVLTAALAVGRQAVVQAGAGAR